MSRDSWFTSFPAVRPSRPGLSVIASNLLVGEYPNPADIAWLVDEHRVTAVLSLQDDADLASKDLRLADFRNACAALSVCFDNLPVADGDTAAFARRLDDIVEVLHAMLARGERVYLHCNAGMNRAPTVAIAYLHVHGQMSLAEATTFVKQRRSCAPYMQLLRARYGE
jgi:protein-tyrosine phosphatase